jgi:hypothetical protein
MRSWWFEIPSVEHPRLARAAFEEADRRKVTIGRLSMGSGLRMLTPGELEEMLELAHERDASLYAYISSRNSWEPLPDAEAGEQLRGEAAYADALAELEYAVAAGVDGVLIADLGLLARAGELRRSGELGDLGLKTAAAIAPQNAATAALYERLGATSINVPSTAAIDDLRAMRRELSSQVSIDIYVESPPAMGGGMRYREVHRFVEELAPLSLKIGLRNAAPLYPYGLHLEPAAEQSIREKLRRAELVLRALEQSGSASSLVGEDMTQGGGDVR